MKILNCSSEFSLGQSLLSVEDIIELAKDVDKVFVCDTMSVSAMIPLASKLKEKVAVGVRLNLVDDIEDKKAKIYTMKVYPQDEAAMRRLYDLLSLSFTRPNFYEVPRISFEQLFTVLYEEPKHNFVFTTGDFFSIFNHPNYDKILSVMVYTHFRPWVELAPIASAKFDRINMMAIQACRTYG